MLDVRLLDWLYTRQGQNRTGAALRAALLCMRVASDDGALTPALVPEQQVSY